MTTLFDNHFCRVISVDSGTAYLDAWRVGDMAHDCQVNSEGLKFLQNDVPATMPTRNVHMTFGPPQDRCKVRVPLKDFLDYLTYHEKTNFKDPFFIVELHRVLALPSAYVSMSNSATLNFPKPLTWPPKLREESPRLPVVIPSAAAQDVNGVKVCVPFRANMKAHNIHKLLVQVGYASPFKVDDAGNATGIWI